MKRGPRVMTVGIAFAPVLWFALLSQFAATCCQAAAAAGQPAAPRGAVERWASPPRHPSVTAASQRRTTIAEGPAGPEIVPAPPPVAPKSQPPSRPPVSTAQRGVVDLPPANVEASDLAFPINLATALRLADARPLIVAAAQSGAWVAEAKLQRAKVLWIPTFNAGSNYIRHDGFGPDFNLGLNTPARPLNQNINFLYSGIGLIQNVAVTDAIFEPLAAHQVLSANRWNIQTAKNDALLATANAYFGVHQHRGSYAGAMDVVRRGRELVERLQALSYDLIPKVEVDRAQSMLADMEQLTATARERWRVASADLTQVLRLDPRVVIVPQEHDHLQITLIDPGRGLDELIPIGLTNRPELESQQAIVRAVAQRIRREKGRILMPTMMLNGFQTPNELIQFGAQGIGHGNSMNHWSLRNDISPQAIWQWEGMGLGNFARIKEQRGEQSKSMVELFMTQDAVAGDVTRAQARLQASAVRVTQADRAMRKALITYDGNFEGLAQTKRFENVLVQVYRPQEAVIALIHLMDAYDNYFGTVADYNRAQFEMYHALGYPAAEVAGLQPPGEAQPVDTSRPAYLPPVGTGPPPASR